MSGKVIISEKCCLAKTKLWEDGDMPLYLGIDAGGTKTDCALSNGAELIGQAAGESCKLANIGREDARKHLQETILNACQMAKVSAQAVQHICIGMSGASHAESVEWARQTIQEVVSGQIYVVGDHVIAHRTAFGTSPGVLVIAGTGSIAFGRNQSGASARAGGWGPLVSDEGSGFWIGKEAVSAALRAYDLGRSNGLLSAIAKSWKVAPEEVVRVANSCSSPKLAELAVPVTAAAETGDISAHEITERAGRELAALAQAVIQRLWPQGGNVRVALAGGVVQGSAIVRQAFREAVADHYPEAAVSFAYVRPVLGALEIAAHRGAPK
ncbi:MAG TPA: BadF/BadG/BcrA/BcrD ATPase family protein [Candidatus Angelobacter sp.]|nr:BadF/BadG/BcrA/BcrD ATPase family protein [Candidatus Angelobacter sp.]